MRPDDRELLRRAARNLRVRGGTPVVFGGLRDERGIRVTTTNGAATARLTTIVVKPDRGLGGRCWSSGQPQAVTDYARATGITHEFDPQILGEGIVTLAVAPIMVRNRVAGLLYAGHRTEHRGAADLDKLGYEASQIAQELLVRDIVDERVRAMRVLDTHPVNGNAYHTITEQLPARLRLLAARTTDQQTALELREILALLEPRSEAAQEQQLTTRQIDVLALVALGLTNDSIATSLGLSPLTVKSYLRSAMARLDAKTRYQAVIEARRLRILP
jgi:LuxR family transcriptional regulator, regulator of acetate metabolism